MDSISAELLVTMATGAAGEAGRQLWAALSGLVRRRPAAGEEPEPATGEVELASLAEAPHDVARALALSEVLAVRAERDPSFLAGLTRWHEQARRLETGQGDTSNSISGGTQNGPVLQGRDFSGITFNDPGQGGAR
ncbi:hypothetical protein QWJ26_35015 [Streptomyces sp. CSDS2]|uniref:hypothetical protein n=1 Tax=Streptomyces sp. CSDS2 TaxID=3055051 RepID=UPI0025B15C82|nr:hypothetical protein [Streptomyces sp. CSDS2]MDN3264925.1 hypothetical protein [Streptomyces sp. CSDS2]